MLTSFVERPVSPRQGFILVAVIVMVAIIAVIAAVVGPSLARALDQERISKAHRSLVKLDSAIVRFKRTTKSYPGFLNDLAVQITTSGKDSCGNNYTGGQVSDWGGSTIDTVGGSYISQPVPPGGLPLAGGLGYARDSLSRKPAGPTGVLEIVMENVPEGDAILLNDKIDGIADYLEANASSGNQTGKVRWTAPSPTRTVSLTYNVIPPSSGC